MIWKYYVDLRRIFWNIFAKKNKWDICKLGNAAITTKSNNWIMASRSFYLAVRFFFLTKSLSSCTTTRKTREKQLMYKKAGSLVTESSGTSIIFSIPQLEPWMKSGECPPTEPNVILSIQWEFSCLFVIFFQPVDLVRIEVECNNNLSSWSYPTFCDEGMSCTISRREVWPTSLYLSDDVQTTFSSLELPLLTRIKVGLEC